MTSTPWKRVRQHTADGRVLSEVTMHTTSLAALTDEQRARIEVLDEPALDRHSRPRPPSYPAPGTGTGERAGYADQRVADLEAEIARRNESRDDDHQVVVAPPGHKADLVAALVADDTH